MEFFLSRMLSVQDIFRMSPVWELEADDLDVQMKALNLNRIISESYG